MAIRATARWSALTYAPGNPEFPTLPDGVPTPHVHDWGQSAGLRARVRVGTRLNKVRANAPAQDDGRYAGWQTLTTWINPAIVDFGVIPSPVQRTFSLYNARPDPITVTAITLPAGVTLISPSLPVTLNPYAGDTFTLEASTTGANSFDTTETITTSEGTVPLRLLGERIFTLTNIPQTPIRETLLWKTDLIQSRNATEKAYSLLQAPSIEVDYNVYYDQDDNQARQKLRNQFIAGESALVVSGQKWYDMRLLSVAAEAADTTLQVSASIKWSLSAGDPISLVTVNGQATNAVVDTITYTPDEYADEITVLVRWDEDNGALTTTELVSGDTVTMNSVASVSTAQSKFGGSSLHVNGQGFPTPCVIPYRAEHIFEDGTDFTIDFWCRPTAADITGGTFMVTRWDSRVGGVAGYVWWIQTYSSGTGILFGTRTAFDSNNHLFPFNSPRDFQADTWHYVRICRFGTQFYCFVDGVQLGADVSEKNPPMNQGVGVDIFVGARYIGGSYIPFNGYIDDLRITKGTARSTADFTPPTSRHTTVEEQELILGLASAIGTTAPVNSYVMPVGLGYVSKFPRFKTRRDNLESFEYTLTFNQENDLGALDTTYFPTLTDLQSPENVLPILDFPNIMRSTTKDTALDRTEDVLDSGLSNRQAYSWFPFAEEVQEFAITTYSEDEMWAWKTFFYYLRGSYNEFYVPTFTDDIPGVTTSGGGNTFTANETAYAASYGNPPDPRKNAIRLEFDDGTIEYRLITAVVDNGATEDFTLSASVTNGTPKISFLQRARILGDTVTIEHERTDYARIKFRYRTIQR